MNTGISFVSAFVYVVVMFSMFGSSGHSGSTDSTRGRAELLTQDGFDFLIRGHDDRLRSPSHQGVGSMDSRMMPIRMLFNDPGAPGLCGTLRVRMAQHRRPRNGGVDVSRVVVPLPSDPSARRALSPSRLMLRQMIPARVVVNVRSDSAAVERNHGLVRGESAPRNCDWTDRGHEARVSSHKTAHHQVGRDRHGPILSWRPSGRRSPSCRRGVDGLPAHVLR